MTAAEKQLGNRLVVLLLAAVSGCLMLFAPGSPVAGFVNVGIAGVLLFYPPAFLPLILVSSLSSSITAFSGLAALFFYLLMFLLSMLIRGRWKLELRWNRSMTMMALFSLWILVSTVLSPYGEAYSAVRQLILVVLIVLCTWGCHLKYGECEDAMILIGAVVSTACVVKLILFPERYTIVGTYVMREALSLSKDLNPNQIAAVFSVMFVFFFISLLRGKKLAVVPLLMSFAVLVLLKSRTAFFSALIVCGLYFLLRYRTSLKNKLLICGVLLVLFGGTMALSGRGSAVESDKKLSVSSIVEDSGSGRFLTWAEAFTLIIPSNPITGIGFGSESFKNMGYDFDADNMYVDLLSETGIVGFALFFAFFIMLAVRVARKRTAAGTMVLYLLFLQLFLGIGETVFDSQLFWCVSMLCMLPVDD